MVRAQRGDAGAVGQPHSARVVVRPGVFESGERALAEETHHASHIAGRPERQAELNDSGAAGNVGAPLRPSTHRGRSHPEDLTQGVVELAEAGEPGGERDVAERDRGRLDQDPRRVRPVRPRQAERSGTELGGQHPGQVAFRVAELVGQPAHTGAVHDPVGDQPHGATGEIGAQVPLRRTRHGIRQAPSARAVPGGLRSGGRGEEQAVVALGRAGRAGGAAVDTSCAHGMDETAVETGVACGDGPQRFLGSHQHAFDRASAPGQLLAGIRHAQVRSQSPHERLRRRRPGPVDEGFRSRFVLVA